MTSGRCRRYRVAPEQSSTQQLAGAVHDEQQRDVLRGSQTEVSRVSVRDVGRAEEVQQEPHRPVAKCEHREQPADEQLPSREPVQQHRQGEEQQCVVQA